MFPMSAMSEFHERLAKIPKRPNFGVTATHNHAFVLFRFVGDPSK